MDKEVIIIGGGASGLAACAALAQERSQMRIALVEKLDRVGKKILTTGNGRCNLSNTDMTPAHYAEAADFVSAVFETTPPCKVKDFFSSIGLMTATEDGRIYPRTFAASSVLDVLRSAVDRANVSILTGHEVVGLERIRKHGIAGWRIQFANGDALTSSCVIYAAGGCASPSSGTDGKSFGLLKDLNHTISPLYPALVQLRCDHGALKSLKGIRIHAGIKLEINDRIAAQEAGELLFADYGVSGVCVFQISRHVEKAIKERNDVRLHINLLPEIAQSELEHFIRQRITLCSDAPAEKLFTGVFHRMLTLALLREAGILPDSTSNRLTTRQITSLIHAISDFTLPVTGTQGFKQAQVTRGGVDLCEVNPRTMASYNHSGLYITGEALDVDGPCGGYNLHFAFASALTAVHGILSEYPVF